MISNRNDIFRCLIIGSCLFIFWGVIIIWIVSYQNLCHALYLTLYFSKYSGVTIIWNSTRSMPWDVPINWNMSSNWHQRVLVFIFWELLWLTLSVWFVSVLPTPRNGRWSCLRWRTTMLDWPPPFKNRLPTLRSGSDSYTRTKRTTPNSKWAS